MKPSRIVVTGANGFIGSHVVNKIAKSSFESQIIGIGRKVAAGSQLELENYKYIQCDLLDRDAYRNLPGQTDILIHLAGDRRTFVKPDDYTPQALDNVVMTSYLSDYAYSSGAKLFMYASSVYIYSGNSKLPFKEYNLTIPADNLGASKLASEALLKARSTAGHFKAVAFRIGTVFGPGASKEQFIPQAIMKLSAEGSVAKFGAGDIKRDFIFVEDVADAFVAGTGLCGMEDDFCSFNLASGVPTSIREVVKILSDLLGNEKKIDFTAENKSNADTDHQLDISCITSVLGWKPSTSLSEGLQKTINSFFLN